MKKQISIAIAAIIVAVFCAQTVLASSLSLAKQWEARGNFAKAAEEYSMAAAQTDNLNSKAELMYEVGRCRIRSGDASFIGALINDIKSYSSDRGAKFVPKLLAQLEEFAWRAGDEEARQALSVIITENPGRRQALSDKANAKNRKALAYWLNPALNEADCKAKRAKALKAENIAGVVNALAAMQDVCTGTPSETEYKAFATRAKAEKSRLLALPLYEWIKAMWGRLDVSEVDELIELVRETCRLEEHNATIERVRKLAPEDVEEILPHQKVFGKGRSPQHLNNGERTPWWIATSVRGTIGYDSDHPYFEIIYENGERFQVWDDESKARLNSRGSTGYKFYLKCVEPNGKMCNIFMKIE